MSYLIQYLYAHLGTSVFAKMSVLQARNSMLMDMYLNGESLVMVP